MSSSGQFGDEFRDPYIDFVLSQLLTPSEAIKLTRPEFEIIMAAVRSEILTAKTIRKILTEKVHKVIAELESARKHFP
jgi:hypothetical protein